MKVKSVLDKLKKKEFKNSKKEFNGNCNQSLKSNNYSIFNKSVGFEKNEFIDKLSCTAFW